MNTISRNNFYQNQASYHKNQVNFCGVGKIVHHFAEAIQLSKKAAVTNNEQSDLFIREMTLHIEAALKDNEFDYFLANSKKLSQLQVPYSDGDTIELRDLSSKVGENTRYVAKEKIKGFQLFTTYLFQAEKKLTQKDVRRELIDFTYHISPRLNLDEIFKFSQLI
jgi:hypothetical protein